MVDSARRVAVTVSTVHKRRCQRDVHLNYPVTLHHVFTVVIAWSARCQAPSVIIYLPSSIISSRRSVVSHLRTSSWVLYLAQSHSSHPCLHHWRQPSSCLVFTSVALKRLTLKTTSPGSTAYVCLSNISADMQTHFFRGREFIFFGGGATNKLGSNPPWPPWPRPVFL